MKKFSDKFVEKIKARFIFSNFFLPENPAGYDVGFENMIQPNVTDDNIKRYRKDAICVRVTEARIQKHTRDI